MPSSLSLKFQSNFSSIRFQCITANNSYVLYAAIVCCYTLKSIRHNIIPSLMGVSRKYTLNTAASLLLESVTENRNKI